jgi:hypothetical protein
VHEPDILGMIVHSPLYTPLPLSASPFGCIARPIVAVLRKELSIWPVLFLQNCVCHLDGGMRAADG